MSHPTVVIFILVVLTHGVAAQESNKCSKTADIAFVIDSSSSIHINTFKKQKQFVRDILDLFDLSPDKTRVAAVSYSSVINHEFYFNTYRNKRDILAAIDRVRYTAGDGTRTYKALQYMNNELFKKSNGARSGVIQIAIVMTDGETNPAGYDNNISLEKALAWTQSEARKAKDDGIFVFAIGIGSSVNWQELNGIASEPKSNFAIEVSSYQELDTQQLKQIVAYRTCGVNDEPTPVPTPPPTLPPTTRRPQEEEPKKECKGMVADVIFIIDESFSIDSQKMFNFELNFVSNVVGNMDIGPDRTRVGVIVFADRPRTVFNLKDFSTTEEIQKAVNRISLGGGNTFTNLALELMLKDGFTTRNGARDNVPKIAVVITDGKTQFPIETKSLAQKAKKAGIRMFAIGAGNFSVSDLSYIASDPIEQYVFMVTNLQALDTIKEQLSINLCQEPQEDQPEEVCPGKAADVVIISDASGSIGNRSFNRQLKFISDLVDTFDIGPDNVQVGMITFATNANMEFALNQYTTQSDLKDAIKKVRYTGGQTYTNKALDLMLRRAFTTANGRTRDVLKICIVITDGVSNVPSETERLAMKAKGDEITMFSIGVGQRVVSDELEKIASFPSNHYSFMVTDFNALEKIRNSLAARTCGSGTKGSSRGTFVSR